MPRWWRAPAKLNLYLHVTGRRDDGYHLLDSLVAFADIGDRVRAEAAERLSLAVTGPFAAALANDDPSNLVWRAAEALAQRLGRKPAAALTLEKNLPVASGIGGGSSDAAAALRALVQLWQARLDETTLLGIAASLGADVPVCLAARASWFAGIGDEVEPAPDLPPLGIVLANPGIALPTARVFAARRGPFSAPARFAKPADAAALVARLAERRNDLTEAAIAQVPVIATVLQQLAAAENVLLARMSGSGATCFALFATTAAAAAAADTIRRGEPGWWVAAGHLI
jgi:4-diphosphocytidyl-2-C-methyl-D-erythritol kinase